MRFRFWFAVDTAMHYLGLHIEWVCDQLDFACGLTREDMERT